MNFLAKSPHYFGTKTNDNTEFERFLYGPNGTIFENEKKTISQENCRKAKYLS